MKLLHITCLLFFFSACQLSTDQSSNEKNKSRKGLPAYSNLFSCLYDETSLAQDNLNAVSSKEIFNDLPQRTLITLDENGKVLSKVTFPKDSIPKRVVLLNTTYCTYTKALDAIGLIKGVAAFETLKSGGSFSNQDIVNVGEKGVLNIEKIQALEPDLVICSSFQVKELGMIDCPVLIINEFWENHPLARAEWIKAFALIVGKKELADVLFDNIVAEYEQYAESYDETNSVINIQLYSSQYFVPGCEALLNRSLSDAGYSVLCEKGTAAKSTELSKEDVLASVYELEYLIYFDWTEKDKSYEEVLDHLNITGYFSGKIIYCNTMLNDYINEAILSPQKVLQELSSLKKGKGVKGKYFSILKP